MGPGRTLVAAPLVALTLVSSALAATEPIEVQAESGELPTVVRSLRAQGAEIERRDGNTLQVSADQAQLEELQQIAAVASAEPAPTAFADEVMGEGLERQGGAPFVGLAGGGTGLVIAILDLGFGPSIDLQQANGELPPDIRLHTASFDTVNGLAGRNAYGNATNHGELVAQTVYDYAPKAHYLFVNYRTRLDFVAAANFLTEVRPNIVVHSNSFLEGPFDGSGPEAQAVDRVAAAGTLWFNSAGNYAQRHWEGPWVDQNADGALDLGEDGTWTFERAIGEPTSFAVSWYDRPAEIDLALIMQRQEADGSWTTVAESDADQSEGARLSERIVGYRDGRGGRFRVRVERRSGPAPEQITLFCRELDLADAGGDEASSQPSPGDAAGAISVGAVDWRGDTRKRYSSVGPSDDGRAKPDLVAPTNTSIMGKTERRRVGGTSNAAPNAAGAAALIMGSLRRTGQSYDAAAVRAHLLATPVDLGAPGIDPIFGAGRPRLEVDPPRLIPASPRPFQRVRSVVRSEIRVDEASRLARWQVFVDGEPVTPIRTTDRLRPRIDTRRLEDGWHRVQVEAADWPGNVGRRDWWINVDNQRPDLTIRAVRVSRPRPARLADDLTAAERTQRRARAPRRVRAALALSDNEPGAFTLDAFFADVRGRRVSARRARVAPGARRVVTLGAVGRGRYRIRLVLRDRVGNARLVTKIVAVR